MSQDGGGGGSVVLDQNPRGIPRAPFVSNVPDFLKGDSVETTLAKLQEMTSKYKFMESHLLSKKKALSEKIPEIRKTLDMVEFLDEQQTTGKEFETQYEVSDTLWASATVKPTRTVNLWLGANVMLEYPIQEAKDLLVSKLDSAHITQRQIEEDLEYVKEQITTTEVNLARVYNFDVKIKRASGAAKK